MATIDFAAAADATTPPTPAAPAPRKAVDFAAAADQSHPRATPPVVPAKGGIDFAGAADRAIGAATNYAGEVVKSNLQPYRELANAVTAHLPASARKSVTNAERVTGSGLQEASSVLGGYQDVLGAAARDVQDSGPGALFVGGPHERAMYDEFRGALQSPNRARNLEAVNAKYQILSPTTLAALRDGKPNAMSGVAGQLAKYPHLAGLASLALEATNPLALGAGKLAEGAAGATRLAAGAARANEVTNAAARAARAQQIVAAVKAGAKSPVNPVRALSDRLENTLVKGAGEVRDKVGSSINVRHELEKAGSPKGALAVDQRKKAAIVAGHAEVETARDDIFNGLTRSQRIELQHRYESPNRPDAEIGPRAPRPMPQPKPTITSDERAAAKAAGRKPVARVVSIDERVQRLRSFQEGLDARLKAEDPRLLPTETANYLSRSGTEDFPVYVQDETAARGVKSRASVKGAGNPGGIAAGARRTAERKYPTLEYALTQGGETLHPTYDPAAQFERASKARMDSLVGQRSIREYQNVPVTNAAGDATTVRAPYRHELTAPDGTIMQFVDEAALRKYANQVSKPRAIVTALAERNVDAMPRISVGSESLRQRLVGATRAAVEQGKVDASVLRDVRKAAGAVDPAAIVNHLAPQGQRIGELRGAIVGQDQRAAEAQAAVPAARAALNDARGGVKDATMRARGEAADERERTMAQDPGASAVQPDWSRASGGKWNLAGEWADVPKRYLNLSNKPGRMHPESFVAGNADDVAKIHGFDDEDHLREWMRDHPRPNARVEPLPVPSDLHDAVNDATRAQTVAERAAAKTQPTPPTVREAARSVEREQASTVQRISTEAAIQHARANGASIRAVKRVGDAQQILANTLMKRLDEVARVEQVEGVSKPIVARTEALLKEYADKLVEKGTLYPRGFERDQFMDESELAKQGLGAVDSADYVMHVHAAKYIENALQAGAPRDEVIGLMRFFNATKSLARVGMILNPTVHGIWNLGRAFLREGGPINQLFGTKLAADAAISPEMLSRVRAGGHIGDATTWGELAEQAGANVSFRQSSFGLGPERAATVRTLPGRSLKEMLPGQAAPESLSRAGTIDKALSRAMDVNSKIVFGVFEKRYVAALLKKFVEEDGMELPDAVRRVRKAFGDYDNVTALERQWTGAFLFYPWMKTSIPFWIKHGFFHPEQFNAPITAIRQNNEGEGDPMADASLYPWRMDMWKEANGKFQYLNVPDPVRNINAFSTAARAPLDFFQGVEGRGQGGKPEFKQGAAALASDVQPVEDYLRGHVQPIIAPIANALLPGQSRYQRLVDDENAPPEDQIGAAVDRAAGGLVAPYQNAKDLAKDPLGVGIGMLVGGFAGESTMPGGSPEDRRVAFLVRRIDAAIAKARERGDIAELTRLYARRGRLKVMGVGGGATNGAPPTSTAVGAPATSPYL